MTKHIIIFFTISLLILSCSSEQGIDEIGSKGIAFFEQGEIKKALKQFNQVLKIDSLNSEAYIRKADCLDLIGDFQNSILNYTKAINIDSKNKITHYNRALTYEKLGKLNKALTDYNSSIILDPKNTSDLNNKLIFHNIGILHGQMNQIEKAITAFSEAINLDKKYADAYHNRGYAYEVKGDYLNAIENFNTAINLEPNNQSYKDSKTRSKKLLKK